MPQWEYCTFSHDMVTITYQLYKQEGLQTSQTAYNDHQWAWCIATSGLLTWEAIGGTPLANGSLWYFKRVIDPNNDYITIT